MSNYYAPCFYRVDFVVIPSYIELPCCNLRTFTATKVTTYLIQQKLLQDESNLLKQVYIFRFNQTNS